MWTRPLSLAILLLVVGLVDIMSATLAESESGPRRSRAVVFDPDASRLPPGFTGQNFMTIFKKLAATKGEYETTEAFRARARALATSAAFAFAITPEVEYDADARGFNISPYRDQVHAWSYAADVSDLSSVLVKRIGAATGHYVGTNGFGATVRVERDKDSTLEVVVEYHSLVEGSTVFLAIPPERAAQVRGKLRFLLVGRPRLAPGEETAAITSAEHVSPGIDHPYDIALSHRYLFAEELSIWVYDRSTGEVLGKLPFLRK
jgi:hypothetical protein